MPTTIFKFVCDDPQRDGEYTVCIQVAEPENFDGDFRDIHQLLLDAAAFVFEEAYHRNK